MASPVKLCDSKETAKRLSDILYERRKKPIEISEETGIHKSSISQYLSGRSIPSNISAGKLAQALNCNPLYLMGFDVGKNDPWPGMEQSKSAFTPASVNHNGNELKKETETNASISHIKQAPEAFDLRAICAAKIQRLSDSQVQYISNIIDQLLFSDTNNTNI